MCVSFPQKSVAHRARVVPIILAAGASTRMGKRKECLQFCDVTCLHIALGNAVEAGFGTPIVATRSEREKELEADFLTKRIVVSIAINPQPDLGQTSSLLAGLQVLPAGVCAFLIYPVDYPLVRAGDLDRLYEAYAQPMREGESASSPTGDRSDAGSGSGLGESPLIVAPSFRRRRGHPVLVDASLAPELLALAPGGSARDVLARHAGRTRYVDFDDDRVLVDMDTPEDYAHCLARYAFGS